MFLGHWDLHARRCPVHFRPNWNIDHSGKNTFLQINVDMSISVSAVADLGFPQGGGANSAGGGRQHRILPNLRETA